MENERIAWLIPDMTEHLGEGRRRRLEDAHVHLDKPSSSLIFTGKVPQIQRCRPRSIRHPNRLDPLDIGARHFLSLALIPQIEDGGDGQIVHQDRFPVGRDICQVP